MTAAPKASRHFSANDNGQSRKRSKNRQNGVRLIRMNYRFRHKTNSPNLDGKQQPADNFRQGQNILTNNISRKIKAFSHFLLPFILARPLLALPRVSVFAF
jgi:hypothetical protein